MDTETALFYQLLGVMHSVDKWLEGDELKHDAVNRAAIMRKKTLQIVESLQCENESLRSQLGTPHSEPNEPLKPQPLGTRTLEKNRKHRAVQIVPSV